jgi:catechol 2,3-dioxygenase-like lactoylglutathione lyase family enzyme
MFDHLGFAVVDFDKSLAFYKAALAPLGIGVEMQGDGYAGLGRPGRMQFLDQPRPDASRPRAHCV